MDISTYAVRRPITIVVIYALAIGIAATLVPNIAVDLYPSTARPVLSVFTRCPGTGPSDVERNVTERLERALTASRGLVNITSNSQFEYSFIDLEFAYGTDMDQAVIDAQTLVNRLVNSLPDDVETPIVRRFDMAARPIMRLVVRGDYSPDQLRLFAEDEIQANIERVEGVAAAEVTGGTRQIVKIDVSLNRLAAYNLSLNDISSALRGQSVLSSGGSLKRGTKEYQIMTQEELVSLDQIKRLVVKTVGVNDQGAAYANRSQVIRLEDIADVNFGYNENVTRVYVNGSPGVYIQVTAESNSNQVQVADRVKAALAEINEYLPRGITLDVLFDNTTMIKATLNQVYTNAYQGAALAMLILLLFLRNIKGTIIIGLAIPISILLTLMFMSVFGFTLNLLTMTGLIMGLGMTMDGSIVILENVYKYRERGAKADVAALLGGKEMFRAIVASSTTTLCVFIPLIIFKNDLKEMGQLFNDLIFTVVITLVASLAVAVTLVPTLTGVFLKLYTRKQKPLKNHILKKIDDTMENFLVGLANGYRKALDYCLSHKLLILLLVFIVFAFSMFQFTGVGMNLYIRTRTDDNVNINVTMPMGSTLDTTEAVLFDIEEFIRGNVEGYNNIVLTVRRTTTNFGGQQGGVQIRLPEPARQIDTPASIIEKMTPFVNSIPGTRISFSAGRGMGYTSPIDVAISSRDYDAIMETALEIQNLMMNFLPGIENPAINVDEGAPQLQIEIDRDRAAYFGLSLAAIAQEIRTAMDGYTVSTMSRGDRLINIVVQLREQDRANISSLDAVFIISRHGDRIPLSNVGRIVEGRAPTSIRREKQERVVRVTGNLPGHIAATEMQARLEAVIRNNLVLKEGVRIRYLGEAAEIATYYGRFILIIVTAIFLVFGVMASQFESLVDPLIIFFTVPMLFIGVIWIYKFTGQDMSIFSVIGIVALVGVVVNNGIILVDCTNTLRARGYKVREACLEAAHSRLRPILMTSMTTILGMTPIAFFPGQGADTIQPIGMTFVGGLIVSTFMTLFVVPVIYLTLNGRHDKKETRST